MNAARKIVETPAMDFETMQRNATAAVSLLKGLANERRLMIMCVLSEGEMSVGQLNHRIALSQSALSQHLAVLREQELVRTRRASQTIYYRLADTTALNIISLLHDVYCDG
ncbi:MAG: metalloregulator ArsR/SmtB family transcription factor [Xanthomonadales bacterium]|nr:metalloregulator ArsR/SmtB family transcription factor [Xanthomonadales bacterium]